MKVKVTATHYVDASDWRDAEAIVEQGGSSPEEIISEPASKSPKDILLFAIASKIEDEHRKIFFQSDSEEEYNEKILRLKTLVRNWLENGLEEIIKHNEEYWG